MIKRWLQEGTPRQRITELEAQVAQLEAERDELRRQLERLHELEEANSEVGLENDLLKAELEALKQPAEATGEIRQSRTRKKPLAKAE